MEEYLKDIISRLYHLYITVSKYKIIVDKIRLYTSVISWRH